MTRAARRQSPRSAQVKVHPAGRDQGNAGGHGDQAGEGHRVRVVGVEQGGACPNLAQDGEQHPGVEARPPLGLVHPDVVPPAVGAASSVAAPVTTTWLTRPARRSSRASSHT